MWAVLARSRAMTWSAVSLRWSAGLREQNMRPVLPPPTKPVTFSRAGSDWTAATYWFSRRSMPWNETSWAATMDPTMRPVSCWGKKPLGTMM